MKRYEAYGWQVLNLTSPHLTSPHFASPHLPSPFPSFHFFAERPPCLAQSPFLLTQTPFPSPAARLRLHGSGCMGRFCTSRTATLTSLRCRRPSSRPSAISTGRPSLKRRRSSATARASRALRAFMARRSAMPTSLPSRRHTALRRMACLPCPPTSPPPTLSARWRVRGCTPSGRHSSSPTARRTLTSQRSLSGARAAAARAAG